MSGQPAKVIANAFKAGVHALLQGANHGRRFERLDPHPRDSVKTDWDVALGVVIGARASYLDSPDAATDVVAGYVLANDVSERALQIELSGGRWSKGKSCASINPSASGWSHRDEVAGA